MKYTENSLSLSSFVDGLQESGRYVFTLQEALRLPGRSVLATRKALYILRRQGRIVAPRSGFYVVVPLEYRTAGSPPVSWFIDDFMRHLGQSYYVGLLSAAALHGAAHQQPMTFQVITDRLTRPARTGRARIVFHVNRMTDKIPAIALQTETGSMRVSTPEATAFDLVRYAAASGGLGNVATVLKELSEKIDHQNLADLVSLYALSDAQRLGYLLERIGKSRLTGPLREVLSRRKLLPVRLAVGKWLGTDAPRMDVDETWKVLVNDTVESDL